MALIIVAEIFIIGFAAGLKNDQPSLEKHWRNMSSSNRHEVEKALNCCGYSSVLQSTRGCPYSKPCKDKISELIDAQLSLILIAVGTIAALEVNSQALSH